MTLKTEQVFENQDLFLNRHVSHSEAEQKEMLDVVGASSLDELIDQTVPESIRLRRPLDLPAPRGEMAALSELREIMGKNRIFKSLIGQGYYGTETPNVILRNLLENPGWYTQYTPYQAEISQGRLELLLAFQTMVADLTALPVANASLLDEGTAAAEAMAMCYRAAKGKKPVFFASSDLFPQTLAVLQTRASALGIELRVGAPETLGDLSGICGAIVQYPNEFGYLKDYSPLSEKLHQVGALLVVACDLLSLVQLKAPGEFGADIAVGSAQRFGNPMWFGGPHAAFMATTDALKRQMPGRLVGVSKDAEGRDAYRLSLQTREQHVRREKATSNICTAQALCAMISTCYAIYHGPQGLKQIAARVHGLTDILRRGLTRLGYAVGKIPFFDTISVPVDAESEEMLYQAALDQQINLRRTPGRLGISLDETCDLALLDKLFALFACGAEVPFSAQSIEKEAHSEADPQFRRQSSFLQHPVFSKFHSEHEMLRYLYRLQERDISLTRSMIPLGSCTMKLNPTTCMLPISWPEVTAIHPFAPKDQWPGYEELIQKLTSYLTEITGFKGVSFQPNAGAAGEYSGLKVIAAWHKSRGDEKRKVCLIPASAHGTNPASAVMAGFEVVTVACTGKGDIDLDDLREKSERYADQLGALMITYPSTHGVFEEGIVEICRIVHAHGGLVYFDGANMNAEVGLCRPGDLGADVCHLNLHKTFASPHGGGGPGVGPICVSEALVPFLPGAGQVGPVSSAPFGSAGILPIAYLYIEMMGAEGLAAASKYAILNANYMAERLKVAYPVLYRGAHGRVAHEFILDCNAFKASADIDVDDIAKRLMDFGFHAPTMSFPVHGTLMIEPTESESKAELDRLCDALLEIRSEIAEIEAQKADRADNLLKSAPHTAESLLTAEWPHGYSRQKAAYPLDFVKENKYWPPVSRIDNTYGDRHLVCLLP